jgi:uncharacterized protein (DUF488 family)
MARNPLYLAGLARVLEIAGHSRPVLMCSEHEPLECHRCLLIGRSLANRAILVSHILRDGRIEPHAETEERLLKLRRQTEGDLLASRAERLAHSYREQNQKLWRSVRPPRKTK